MSSREKGIKIKDIQDIYIQDITVLIIQGMACVGKSSLCKRLEQTLPDCKHITFDKYKEDLWDKVGFDSTDRRAELTNIAKTLFYIDTVRLIESNNYKYILLDYTFTAKYWEELTVILKDTASRLKDKQKDGKRVHIKTIYLKPVNLEDHQQAWNDRSRNFSIRHPGHGATSYNNVTKIGYNYINRYDTKIYLDMPVTEDNIQIEVEFNPYKLNKTFEEILEFINN